MPMIIAGVTVPFVLDISVDGPDGPLTHRAEFDTLPDAKAALEAFILAHQDVVHDYGIDLKRGDLQAGDVVRFDTVVRTAPGRPPRQVPVSVAVGGWSISWRKPDAE